MNYTIIQEGDIEALAKSVSTYMAQGWKPQGGVCSFVIHIRHEAGYEVNRLETWFCQALVK